MTRVDSSPVPSPPDLFINEIKSECLAIFKDFIVKNFTLVSEMEMLKRKEYLTEREVELLFSVPVATLQTWRSRGRGPAYIKDGKKVLYSTQKLREYFNDREVKQSGKIFHD